MVKTIEGEKFVEAKSSLKLCDRFLFPFKGDCDQHPCNKLHICRGFLEKSCDRGKRCKRPHTFDNCVTNNLLIQHNLDSLSSSDLKKLFQKALKEQKIRYAATTLGPRVCVFYRKGVTCKGGDKCKFFMCVRSILMVAASLKSSVVCVTVLTRGTPEEFWPLIIWAIFATKRKFSRC